MGSGTEEKPNLSIADDLVHIFGRLFPYRPYAENVEQQPMNAIDAFSRKNSETQAIYTNNGGSGQPVPYGQPMAVLIEDLVEMIAVRFGNLSCCSTNDGATRNIFKDRLEKDDIQSMFGEIGQLMNPSLQFSNYQTLQMIDIWFSHHPLAFLLSKTLLVQNYRNGTHSEILLAVVLGDVASSQQNPEVRALGTSLFAWATLELRNILSQEFDLSLVQTLILLGWHELCSARARRSIVFFLHATAIAPNLRKPEFCSNRINGLDIGEVEAELTRNSRWISFSTVLWMFMQCDAPLLDLLSGQTLTTFPPVNESSSSVYALDVASDNTSTLPHQAKTIKDFWPISHVASTVAHIYALYPRNKPVRAALTPLGTPSWESQTLRRLQNLNDIPRVAPQDFSLLCHKVRHILMSAVNFLENRHEDQVSQKLVLSAYHTLIIHLLFPATNLIMGSGDVLVTDGLIEDFCTSLKALLRASPTLEPESEGGMMQLGGKGYNVRAEVTMIGIDASSRVLAYFQNSSKLTDQRTATSGEKELMMLASGIRALMKRGDELANYGTQLQAMARYEVLRITKRSKAVKKQLKQVVQGFDGSDAYASSTEQTSRRSSQDRSPTLTNQVRSTAPSLVHSSSNDSSTSDSSVQAASDNFGPTSVPSDLQSSLDSTVFDSAKPFVLSDLNSGLNQNFEPNLTLGQTDNLIDGYFDSFSLMPDMQDMGGKMGDEGFQNMFGDFGFPRDGPEMIYQNDLK